MSLSSRSEVGFVCGELASDLSSESSSFITCPGETLMTVLFVASGVVPALLGDLCGVPIDGRFCPCAAV